MSVQPVSNTERELSFFIAPLFVDDIKQTAEIHEIDMCGWRLFECFLYPAQTVVYIGWDEEAHAPEWIDMEEDMAPDFATLLTNAIVQYKKRANAA